MSVAKLVIREPTPNVGAINNIVAKNEKYREAQEKRKLKEERKKANVIEVCTADDLNKNFIPEKTGRYDYCQAQAFIKQTKKQKIYKKPTHKLRCSKYYWGSEEAVEFEKKYQSDWYDKLNPDKGDYKPKVKKCDYYSSIKKDTTPIFVLRW